MEPKVNCRVNKSPSLDYILSHLNPVRILTTYFATIHFYLPMYTWASQIVFYFQVFRLQLCIHYYLRMRAACPAHVIRLDLITLIILGEE